MDSDDFSRTIEACGVKITIEVGLDRNIGIAFQPGSIFFSSLPNGVSLIDLKDLIWNRVERVKLTVEGATIELTEQDRGKFITAVSPVLQELLDWVDTNAPIWAG